MPDDERITLAAKALAAAKADARARGTGPAQARAVPPALDPESGDGRPGPWVGRPGQEWPDGHAGGPRAGAGEPRAAAAEPPAGAGQQEPATSAGPGTGGSPAPGRLAAVAGAPAPRRSAGRPRRDDPAPLSTAINSLITESGWSLAAATGSVFGRWGQIVGPDLAAHTAPGSLEDGELTVTADSTAWATQVRLLAAELIRRLNGELGTGTVRRVRVLGPGAGSRKPGQWRVKGSRGPRDTYG